MTDTRLGRSPRSDKELVREIDRRLKALERSQTARIGPWVLSAPNGRLLATRPGAAPLEVGQEPAAEVVDLSARGSVVSEMNTADLAKAVGYPDVDPEAPPTLDDIREWMVTQLFGQVSPSRIPQVPWRHLFDGSPELLDDPGFDNASTFSSGDPNVSRDAEFGRRRPGSARIEADGASHIVVTNLIPVEQGESLPLGVHVFYEELAASSAPIRVSVRAYHRNADDSVTLLSTTQVAALSVLSGDSADHPDQDDDWVWLGSTYVVPGPIGGQSVDAAVVEVKADATGGTIWVDDATVTKTRDGLPQQWVLNLIPDLGSLWNGVAGTVETIMTQLGLTPSGDFWDDLFDLSDEIAWIQERADEAREGLQSVWDKFWGRIFGNPNATGKSVDDFADAAQLIVDYVRQGADGTGQTDGQMSDAKTAVDGLRQTLSGLQAKVSQILARDPQAGGAPGVVGNVATDDAERAPGTGWGPGWIIPAGFSTNGVRTDGHRWVWSDAGNAARTTPGIYTVTPTLTPYQSVQIVMASLMEQPGWGGPGDPNNWIIFRSNLTGTQFAFVAVHYNRVELWKYDSGTFSKIGADVEVSPAVGARWEMRAGTVVSVDNLVLLMNDRGVANWTPAPGAVWSDTAHVWAGQGMQSDNRNAGEATPGSIEVWTLSDNPPTGTIGSGLIVSSTTTTNVPVSSGTSRIPNGFFNVVEQGSADIAWDGQKVTVRDAGWYAVQLELAVPTGAAGATGVLYRQGTPWKLRRSASPLGGLGSIGGSWNIYLPAGGECGPGINAPSTSPAISSDAAGQTSWFSITKANP